MKYMVSSNCQKVCIITEAKNIDNAFSIANEWLSVSWNNNKVEKFNECQSYWQKEFEIIQTYISKIIIL